MKFRNTILFKIALILSVSVVITLGLLGYKSYHQEKTRLISQNERRIRIRMERLQLILNEPMWTYNINQMKKILEYEFRSSETIAIIIKKENNSFILGGRKENGKILWDYEPDLHTRQPESDILHIQKEIKYQNTIIGYVEFFYSFQNVEEELKNLIVELILQTFIVSLILVLAIYLSLKRIIVRPIVELSLMMEDISSGNYTSRLETKLKDEIGRLVGSFNRMIERLNIQREELTYSEVKYRSLFDYANDAIVLLKDGKTVDCNIPACIMFGRSKDELIGLTPMEAAPPVGDKKEMEVATATYINLALSGETQYFEWEYYDRDGNIKFGQVSLQRVELNDGVYIQAMTRDITEEKENERKIFESEERYRTLVENAPESIFSLSYKDGVISSLNPAFKRITGWDIEEWTGKSFIPLIHPEDLHIAYEKLQMIKTGITPPPFELRMINREGRSFNTEITATPKRENGEVTGVLGIARDITEKKEAEEKLKQSLKEKEILLKEIHHRVKNNLQIISSLLNLQSGHIKDRHALEMFKNSQNRVKSMALIHERLYKSDNLAQINFSEYIKNLTSGLFRSYQTNSSNISLRLEIDEELYLGVDMAIPCGLIVNELVTNALKYAFPDFTSGEIYINFKLLESENYKLIVGNDGIDFPKDVEIRNSQTLGLQLVNILSNQLKGTLELNTGGITEFIIIFPSRKN